MIVDTTTGQFLARDGKWTLREEEALNFDDITSVIEACARYKIEQAEVLLRFQEGEHFDVRLPLRRSHRRAPGSESLDRPNLGEKSA